MFRAILENIELILIWIFMLILKLSGWNFRPRRKRYALFSDALDSPVFQEAGGCFENAFFYFYTFLLLFMLLLSFLSYS